MFKAKAFSAAVVLAAAATAQAGIYTLGTSSTTAPTDNPTINLTLTGGSAQFTLYLWGQAQGPGYLQQMQVGAFASTTPSWAGGQLSTASSSSSNPFVTTTAIQGVSSSLINNTGAGQFLSSSPSSYVNQTTTAANASGFFVPFGISGTNLTAPAGAVTAAAPRVLAEFVGSVSTPGTYYLYLGRRGGGVNESPAFLEAPVTVGNSTRFGFGDNPIQTQGAGSAAEAVSALPDAIIIVRPAVSNPTVLLTPGGTGGAVVPGDGTGYLPTLAPGGVFSFAGNNTGATIVAFDLDGIDGVPDNLELPVGASLVPLTGLFADNLGGSFDFVVNFGNLGNGPFTASISNLPSGVSVNRIAAIPEPAALGLLAPVALMAARRRKA